MRPVPRKRKNNNEKRDMETTVKKLKKQKMRPGLEKETIKMTEQEMKKTFLPKKGNYRGLIVYQKAECIYDITFFFAHHFFVERMTAARLGYRNEQKTRIAELETENATLKARIAELEQKLRKLIGPMGLMGLISLIGHIGLIGRMSLMGLMGLISLGLTACSSGGGDDAVAPAPTPVTEVAISFGGNESQEVDVSNGASGANKAYGANRAYGAYRRAAGAPLSESATRFNVWGYKNMDYNDGTGAYGGTQTVFPGYQVDWHENTAATTTTNSSGWEYIQPGLPDQTIKYWDWGAKAYRYFAVTGWSGAAPPAPPATYEANETYGPTEAYGAYAFSMLADASDATEMAKSPYFSKLWFSTGDPVAYPDKQFGKPVTLEFLKPYARVRFLFKYSTPREGFKLGVPSFKPTDGSKKIARKGTVTVHYPTEGPEIKEWYTVEPNSDSNPDVNKALEAFTEDFDPDDDTKNYTTCDNGWYWVLPNNTQGSYTLTVTVNNSGRSVTVPAQYMQWLPGYSYTYIFKVTEEGGVEIGWVEYAMTPWTEMEVSKSVYNW